MIELIQSAINISEGRNLEVIKAIVNSCNNIRNAKIIDYSMDYDHNRSVLTLLGNPASIKEASLCVVGKAVSQIDLNNHQGGHPRIGAVDVIPIVPVLNATMDDCKNLSFEIGEEIYKQFQVPIYFYEESAKTQERINLANVRKGGFEYLKANPTDQTRRPDIGSVVHPSAGAVCIGAREPLIAFNVNLVSKDIVCANKIAAKIRKLRDSGVALGGVKAIGVYLKSRSLAQVSMNITKTDKVSVKEIFDFVSSEAEALGVKVYESELIGALRAKDISEYSAESVKLCNFSINRIIDNWFDSFS